MACQGIWTFLDQSSDYGHALPEGTIQKVIDWEHGLDPYLTNMTEQQVTRGVWFKHATKGDMNDIIGKTMERHEWEKVCAFIVDKDHAATKAITAAKGTSPMFYNMITLPRLD